MRVPPLELIPEQQEAAEAILAGGISVGLSGLARPHRVAGGRRKAG